MATPTEVRRVTEAYRAEQARRAAAVAALVAAYYKTRVNVQDPASITRWLSIMLPKILEESERSAQAAAAFGNQIRIMELGSTRSHEFEPTVGSVREQIEASLSIVGPKAHLAKVNEIREMDLPRVSKLALIQDARDTAGVRLAGAATRHAQSGGRQTLFDNVKADPVALGYIRVTRENPCYFCIALASRGIVYGEESFDASDPRFTGEGTAKVHDWCACSLKPVYQTDDPQLVNTANFEALWFEYGASTLEQFRRNLRAAGLL